MALGESLSSTPTWAVAVVTAVLVILSLIIEHVLHVLTHFVDRRKRKSLSQAFNQIKGELRNLGFISLLLTMAQQPISKICISTSVADTLLPCKDKPPPVPYGADDAGTCTEKGKVSFMSSDGTNKLQMLIFLLAVFHVVTSLLTLGLGEIKMKKWGSWEEETKTLEHQLSNDPRRFKLAKQTSFGRRHLKFWSNHWQLLWIVCFVRQFAGSVSRADYFALRNGYIDAHLSPNSAYNFHNFLRRSLDKDFKELVTISPAIWIYVILFIFFNAHVFYNHYWLPFIPLVVLLAIGTKLEVIITKMCLKSSRQRDIVSGVVFVNPNDQLFWFGQPRWLLHAIHFIVIQNSFQLAFVTWSQYKYGLHSCFHKETEDFVISLSVSILVQILCAYVTLPLYSLVNQMGSTMRETIFTERVMVGIKNWQSMAKKSLFSKEPIGSTPSTPSASPASQSSLPRSNRAGGSHSWTHPPPPLMAPSPRAPPAPATSSLMGRIPYSQQPPLTPSSAGGARSSSSSSSPRPWMNAASFRLEFPTRNRRELLEIQKVTEEIIGSSGHGSSEGEGGEMSFRMWWTQEMIAPIGGRASSSGFSN